MCRNGTFWRCRFGVKLIWSSRFGVNVSDYFKINVLTSKPVKTYFIARLSRLATFC